MSLDYDDCHGLHCQLTLHGKGSVLLEALHQWVTYRGWMEGLPAPPLPVF